MIVKLFLSVRVCFLSDTRLQLISATQSATFMDYYWPSFAIDNITNTNMREVNCTTTTKTEDNFWQAELVEYSAVRRVTLYLRSDAGILVLDLVDKFMISFVDGFCLPLYKVNACKEHID